jgi:hypothetical protein
MLRIDIFIPHRSAGHQFQVGSILADIITSHADEEAWLALRVAQYQA